MGIHGSATCAMRYEGARGWLVGAPHKGLGAMFLMMNSARLHVGLQGLAHLEMAGQNALRYAFERLQMRAAVRPEATRALYFVARGDGSSVFSADLAAHNRAVNQYQRGIQPPAARP